MTLPDAPSGQSASTEPATTSGNGRRRGLMLLAALPIAGLLVALVADFLSVFTFFAGPGVTGAPTSVSASPQPTASVLPAHPSPSGVGKASSTAHTEPACSSASGTPTDCEIVHRYEVFDGDCTVAGLIGWLGGRPDIDVVRAGVGPLESGGCRADFRVDVRGSASGVLAGETADILRRCYDGASNAVVSCSQPHTAEYVAASISGVARPQDCESAADDYLEIAPRRRSEELRVRSIGSSPAAGDNARCMIEVRGSQRLAVSVRGLRNARLDWVE